MGTQNREILQAASAESLLASVASRFLLPWSAYVRPTLPIEPAD